jgi:hypothetical protein
MRTTISTLAGASALLLLAACSGGGGGSSSGPAYATTLAYTNPTSGAYQLVKDPASSGATLVLDLVGPNGAIISGASFSASADTTKVTWTASIQQGNAFNLGTAPQGLTAKVSGTELQGVVAQKGTGSPATLSSASILAKVTLTLNGNISAGPITFSDGGKGAYMDGSGVHATAVSVGQLSAQ